MHTHISKARLAARVAGVFATTGALAILSADAFTSGHLALDHFLLPVVVAITILSGHLVGKAGWRAPLSAFGFAIVFLIGTGLTVYTSAGRQAKSAELSMGDAAASNAELAKLQRERADAKARWQTADDKATAEMTGQKCLERCKAWKDRATDIQARIDILDAGIKRIGGEKTVAPTAHRVADVLALFGYDHKTAKRLLITLEPFAYSLFLELAAIIAFGYGFGGQVRQVAPTVTPEPGPVVTAEPAKITGQERRDVVVSFVRAHTARHGRPPQLQQLQALHLSRFGAPLPKSTASRWRAEATATAPTLRVVGG